MRPTVKQLLITACASFMTVTVGCTDLPTEYGKTSGNSAYSSINGYGTFRLALENAGFADREIVRLTDRLKNNTDLVVWAPQNDWALNPPAVTWLDSWLQAGNHTLLYIAPDNGSEVEYWTLATPLAPAEQRLEYRRRTAKSQTERMQLQLNPVLTPSYKWFTLTPLPNPETIKGSKGPWKPGVKGAIDSPLTPLEHAIKTTKKTAKGSVAAQNTLTQYVDRSLLETENGTTYVAEITSPQWNDSRIIVVSAGSLLSNFGLTQRTNQLLADRIIQEVLSAKNSGLRVGFLNSDGSPLIVSTASDGPPIAAGMEFLTVWPISLLTMHGIFLGFVICLMLLPIFGRPKRIVRNEAGNFGDHLDAVAALMKRAGGKKYARAKISDYMKRIRGETAGPWVIKELAPQKSVPMHTLRPSRLSMDTVSPGSGEPIKSTYSKSNATAPSLTQMPSKGMNAAVKSQPDGKNIE